MVWIPNLITNISMVLLRFVIFRWLQKYHKKNKVRPPMKLIILIALVSPVYFASIEISFKYLIPFSLRASMVESSSSLNYELEGSHSEYISILEDRVEVLEKRRTKGAIDALQVANR